MFYFTLRSYPVALMRFNGAPSPELYLERISRMQREFDALAVETCSTGTISLVGQRRATSRSGTTALGCLFKHELPAVCTNFDSSDTRRAKDPSYHQGSPLRPIVRIIMYRSLPAHNRNDDARRQSSVGEPGTHDTEPPPGGPPRARFTTKNCNPFLFSGQTT